jgi:hypothetical protein
LHRHRVVSKSSIRNTDLNKNCRNAVLFYVLLRKFSFLHANRADCIGSVSDEMLTCLHKHDDTQPVRVI